MKNIKKDIEKLYAACAMAMILIAASAPASAAIYTYTMTDNGGVLVLDMDARTGSWKGGTDDDSLNVEFKLTTLRNSSVVTLDMDDFTGEINETLNFYITDANGERTFAGRTYNSTSGTGFLQLRDTTAGPNEARLQTISWDNNSVDDFQTQIANVTVSTVSEPGAFGLMALGLGGLMTARRRRRAPGVAGV